MATLYEPPSAFVERLEATFGGRLRIRWSLQRHCWLIEQKVGRGALPAIITPANKDRLLRRDDVIRERDGYALVMEIQPKPVMPCPVCFLPVIMPVMETAEVTCENCQRKGRDGRYKAAWYPLDDRLLLHLRFIDPDNGDLRDRVKAEEEKAAQLKRWEEEAEDRESAALLKDAFLDQLPKAGFPSLTPSGWYH